MADNIYTPKQVVELMIKRCKMGYHRYIQYPCKFRGFIIDDWNFIYNCNYVKFSELAYKKFKETHNKEYLLDVLNYFMFYYNIYTNYLDNGKPTLAQVNPLIINNIRNMKRNKYNTEKILPNLDVDENLLRESDFYRIRLRAQLALMLICSSHPMFYYKSSEDKYSAIRSQGAKLTRSRPFFYEEEYKRYEEYIVEEKN